MKKAAVIALVGIMASVTNGQDTLQWFNDANTPQPLVGPATFPNIPADGASAAIGSLIQLIRVVGTLDAQPSLPTHFSGTGLTADDTVINSTWVGAGIGNDPYYFNSATLASLGVALADSVYLRIYAQPTTGGNNAPASFDYGGGNVGWYFADSTPRQINTLPNAGGIYDLEFNVTSSAAWNFVAVPEPSTMILAGLGMVFLASRRMRRS